MFLTLTLYPRLNDTAAVILYPLNNRYPNYRKPAMWLGAVLCWASLFAASYTTKVGENTAFIRLNDYIEYRL